MLKCHEATDSNSCWNKAQEGEMVFVLLERDPCAAAAVRSWCAYRIQSGLNTPEDPKIQEAMQWVNIVENTHKHPERVASLKGITT